MTRSALTFMLTMASAMPVMGQEAPKEPPPKDDAGPPPPAASTPSPPVEAIPDLDDLLGIKGDESKRPEGDGGKDAQKEALEQLLSGGEVSDVFNQSVSSMRHAAQRLRPAADAGDRVPDTGLATQRLQEEAIQGLDRLIADLQKKQQKSQQKSKSQSDPRDQPPNQQQQQESQGAEPGKDNQGQVSPPPMQEGALRPGLESARAAWGALPARVRDLLMQGSEDRFSSLYEAMTEAYYKRLAEESSKP